MQVGNSASPLASSALPPRHEPGNDDTLAATAERLRDELERVGYVTSHDLQSPLRIILSCCEELNRHPVLSSDPAAREVVKTLADESARMKTLMQGLLEYIRLETFVTSQSLLDLNEVAASAIDTLEPEIKASGATITCDTLPKVMGHRGRLTRLFAFLLENAIKYRAAAPLAVHVSAQRKGGEWEFCVADNGIGFEQEHQDIIFGLFQRLHGAETYPGHGIGLALSRKIVNAHGGAIRVESAPNEGSRFYFTLPAFNGIEHKRQ